MAMTVLVLFIWCLLQLCAGRNEGNNSLVQIYDCTCDGHTQIYECTASGGGLTIWQGTAFNCAENQDMIRLRHTAYTSKAVGDCNDGAISASSVGVSADHNDYMSTLTVMVTEDVINGTIKCSHHNTQDRTVIIGQMVLRVSQESYGPPTDVHVELFERNKLVFAWNEVTKPSHCPYIQYVITATNCGICPNTTINTTITCALINTSTPANHTCMFAVQTEVCGYILGERSEYVIVNLTVNFHGGNGSREQSTEPDLTTFTGIENLNSAAVIAAISSIALVGIGILLLIVVVQITCILMRKQSSEPLALKTTVRDSSDHSHITNNEGQPINQTPNKLEGIYSVLQPLEDNVKPRVAEDTVVYADVSQRFEQYDHGLHTTAWTISPNHDDQVKYTEIVNSSAESTLDSEVTSDRVNTIVPLQLLLQIGSEGEVAARWYEFGRALGTDRQILEECANYPPEEAIVEIFGWWARNRQVTWKDVYEVLNNIGFQKLATCILKGGKLATEKWSQVLQQPPSFAT